MINDKIPYKIYLEESEMPKAWYNLRADMKVKPAPLLNPQTLKPMTLDELSNVFCTELAKQELDDDNAYIEEVNELVGDIIPEGDYDTLGGFLISNLGFLPKNEDKNELQFENLKFTILNVEERRIGKVRVEIEPKTEIEE